MHRLYRSGRISDQALIEAFAAARIDLW